jgi:hypothetical protein
VTPYLHLVSALAGPCGLLEHHSAIRNPVIKVPLGLLSGNQGHSNRHRDISTVTIGVSNHAKKSALKPWMWFGPIMKPYRSRIELVISHATG